MPRFYSEDQAVKTKLQGLSVSDATSDARPVTVRYRAPENAYADQSFPLIVIDRAGFSFDPARAHTGYIRIPYVPEGYRPYPSAPGMAGSPYWSEFPVPLFVDYSITLLCRKAAHLTSLVADLAAFDYLPPRYGYLVVPSDGTVRRLDVLGGPNTDAVRDEQNKRLLRATWRIRTTAELIWAPIDEPAPATTVDLTVTSI